MKIAFKPILFLLFVNIIFVSYAQKNNNSWKNDLKKRGIIKDIHGKGEVQFLMEEGDVKYYYYGLGFGSRVQLLAIHNIKEDANILNLDKVYQENYPKDYKYEKFWDYKLSKNEIDYFFKVIKKNVDKIFSGDLDIKIKFKSSNSIYKNFKYKAITIRHYVKNVYLPIDSDLNKPIEDHVIETNHNFSKTTFPNNIKEDWRHSVGNPSHRGRHGAKINTAIEAKIYKQEQLDDKIEKKIAKVAEREAKLAASRNNPSGVVSLKINKKPKGTRHEVNLKLYGQGYNIRYKRTYRNK